MPRVYTGLDIVTKRTPVILKDRKVGLICNPSSVNSSYEHAMNIFIRKKDLSLAAAFGPQHGIFGEKQANMIESSHSRSGRIPVYSLYSSTRKPTKSMVNNLDALVFDIQDVGARYYTYIYTMYYCMEACAEKGIPLVVLDRPNPINGNDVEGNTGSSEFSSFVGLFDIAARHGMTVGEIASLMNRHVGCDLHVVMMRNWNRDMYFEQTGLPWIPPSPNIPHIDSAVVYPGACLLEGTNISEGRGTTRPFETVGAPFIKDPDRLASSLNRLGLPGVLFRKVFFEPKFDKWQDRTCGGVFVHVTSRKTFRPFLTYLSIISNIRKTHPGKTKWLSPPYEYEHRKLPIDILLRSKDLRKMVEKKASPDAMKKSWQPEKAVFLRERRNHLYY